MAPPPDTYLTNRRKEESVRIANFRKRILLKYYLFQHSIPATEDPSSPEDQLSRSLKSGGNMNSVFRVGDPSKYQVLKVIRSRTIVWKCTLSHYFMVMPIISELVLCQTLLWKRLSKLSFVRKREVLCETVNKNRLCSKGLRRGLIVCQSYEVRKLNKCFKLIFKSILSQKEWSYEKFHKSKKIGHLKLRLGGRG